MKHILITMALVLAAATIASAGPRAKKYKEHTIHGTNYDKSAIEKLLDESVRPAEVTADENGVTVLSGRFKLDKSVPEDQAALDFINRHKKAFRLKEPLGELVKKNRNVLPNKTVSLRFQQTYNDVPFWRKGLRVHLTKEGDIYLIEGGYVPTPELDTTPLVTKKEAAKTAKKAFDEAAAGEAEIPAGSAVKTKLYIYDNRLAYQVLLDADNPAGGWQCFVDARNGAVISKDDVPEEQDSGLAPSPHLSRSLH